MPARSCSAPRSLTCSHFRLDKGWPELLGALFQLSMDPDSARRETAFRIFANTPGIIEKQHEDTVVQAFSKGFKDDSVSVRLASMDAFAAFFRSITKKRQASYFALLPEVLNILIPIKESQDSDDLSKALVSLIELAELSPKMFKPLFRNLVQFSISVIQDKDLTDTCRQNALELMATFADYAPSMCRKDETFTNDMVMQCLSLMTDLGEDDENAVEWLAQEDVSGWRRWPSFLSSYVAHNANVLSVILAGSRRERFEPHCWRAVHGPFGEQTRRRHHSGAYFQLAPADDVFYGMARQACCLDGHICHLGRVPGLDDQRIEPGS